MWIFYCCYGRAHSSVTAAAIHLEQLPSLTPRAIFGLPDFDRATTADIGIPKFVGRDCAGNCVFILGCGPAKRVIIEILQTILLEHGMKREDLRFVDLQCHLNLLTRVGGFLSRRLGLTFPGKQIAAIGIACMIKQIQACVDKPPKKSR